MEHEIMDYQTDTTGGYIISQTSLMELHRVHRRLKGLIHALEKQPESEMDVLDLDEIQALIGHQLTQIRSLPL